MGSYFADLITPTVRLGVTGLARSGKTVFITALVRNLVEGGRLPFFGPAAEGRLLQAFLQPQPDDAVPRFAYEEHLAALADDPPRWPQSTRRISQLRVTLDYLPRSRLKRTLGIRRLHIDIVDYPGEWLLDLALSKLDYAGWSNAAIALAQDARHARLAAPWLNFVRSLDASADQDEQQALTGSALYAAYLKVARAQDPELSTLGPGRFLMPGDLDGSPLLTFMPMPIADPAGIRRGSMAAMLERRYTSYKAHVVTPFFRDHFSRLDRQIVLVDALAVLNAGEAALADYRRAIAAVLAPFKSGTLAWPISLVARRIDRVLFAAAKADHVHHSEHAALESLLERLVREAAGRASLEGADVKLMALSALRATREADVKRGKDQLACVVGVPLAGESIAGQTFDGIRQAAIFPGDLPAAKPSEKVSEATAVAAQKDVRFVRFRPPRIGRDPQSTEASPWPHIRLDRALDFLLGDHLA